MAMQLPEETSEASPVLVSRQPVLDVRDRVVGYRLSYSLLSGGFPVMPTPEEAIAIVDDVLTVIDHDEQVLGNKAHLSFSREMLLRGELPEISPDQVLLRIRYEDAAMRPLIPVIERAARHGFELELDELPSSGADLGLLDYFSAVEIDVSRWAMRDAAGALERIQRARSIAVAAGVNTHAQRASARELGFEWFSGRFFATPNVLAGTPIPIGDLHTIVELYRMQRSDTTLEELVAVIEQEVGLGLRLLKYMNSAYFGFSGRVRSITQAATMLGTRGLSRWALIVAALSGSKPIPRELALTALTRARACELVGLDHEADIDSDELFTIGLLSTCDAVFGMPMAEVVKELPLTAEVIDALVDRAGPAGDILQSVISYEQGEFLAPTLRASLLANAAAYREALDWARRAIYGMA